MISKAFKFLALLAVVRRRSPLRRRMRPRLCSRPARSIGFVPPPGFTVSKHFPGFENSDGGSMVLLTLPPQAYADIEKSMTPEAFKAQGITEEKRENLTLPDGKGVLVIGIEQENGQKFRKWMFLGSIPAAIAIAAVRIPDGAVKSDSGRRHQDLAPDHDGAALRADRRAAQPGAVQVRAKCPACGRCGYWGAPAFF